MNVILANRSHVMVLRTLYEAAEPLTGRAVERRCGLSNRTVMNALDTLVEARAVDREEAGRAYHFRLNRNHYLVARALKPAFEAEDAFWLDVAKLVRRVVRPHPLAAVATGPLARDETDYGGRLLLAMLFSTGRNRIRAMPSISRLAETVRDRYAMILEPSLLDTNTMDRQEYIPLWRRIEREGILLFGTLP
ncbi:MAG: hypothetical protein JW951_04065 [Lentisphaerae bacterium]|nr:hypothetical protein [Lentisphaerota bacterium]